MSISEFAPSSAPIGASVIVFGTGFSSTAASNTVTFNGTSAAVTAATANQLVVTVPTGATSGPLAVTTPIGSATGANFTVIPSTGAPTITSFSPQIWDGTSNLTITGTNFDAAPAKDRVNLNLEFATPATATATTLTVPVPAAATSGRVAVGTAAGTATSTNDLYIAPPGLAPANLVSTGRTTVGGSQTASIPTAGQFGMVLFDGLPGHRMSATFTYVSIGSGTATLYDPFGQSIASTSIGNSNFIDVVPMRSAGTYSLAVAPAGSFTGNATVNLFDVHDITGTMTIGNPYTFTTTVPGQNGALTFSPTAGHRISLVVGAGPLGSVTVMDPTNTTVASTNVGALTNFIEPFTVVAGTYTVLITHNGSGTGSITLTLYDVPPDLTGTITPGGPALTSTVNTPGQDGIYTINTPTNNRVSLLIAGGGAAASILVLNPNGTTLTSASTGVFANFIQPWTFASGQAVKVDFSGAATGSVTLNAYDVLPDVSGSLTIGGSAFPVTISTPGQKGSLTFSGTASQQATVHITGNNMSSASGGVAVTLLSTDGTTVLTSTSSTASNFNLSTVTLPSTGTYTIQIAPVGANTGVLNVAVTSP